MTARVKGFFLLALPAITALAACGSCTRTPASDGQVSTAAVVAVEAEGPECEGDQLPHISEDSLVPPGLQALIAAAKRGSVAVTWDGSRAEIVDDCRLPGSYYEVLDRTERGGIYWPNSRMLFRTDEMPDMCQRATHLLAAFATGPAEAQSSSGGGGAARHMRGILVPLPCPSVEDTEPATGCIGRGLTGAERRDRATVLMNALKPEPATRHEAAKRLELVALAPDDFRALEFARVITGRIEDNSVSIHLGWLRNQYLVDTATNPPSVQLRESDARSPPPPDVQWNLGPHYEVMGTPLFRRCFRELVDPDIAHEVLF